MRNLRYKAVINCLFQTLFLSINYFLGNRLPWRLNYVSRLSFDTFLYPGGTFNKFLTPVIGRTKKGGQKADKFFRKLYLIPIG